MSETTQQRILLVVEDGDAGRRALSGVLLEAGFAVVQAASGEAVLRLAAQDTDLILLDTHLPDLSGLEVCQRLKTDPHTRSIPVLHLSAAHVAGRDLVQGKEGGADGYLPLPVEPAVLVATIQAFLRLRDTQAALRASEDRYRDLVENSQDLICTHDLQGRLLSVNGAVVRLSGYAQEELLGMNLVDLLTRGARDSFAAYLTEISDKGSASGLMHVRTAAGETRCWEFKNTLRREGVADPVVRGMAQDITERRRAEDSLRQSEERFRSLTALSSDYYWETDVEHRLTLRSVGRKDSTRASFRSGPPLGQRRWEVPSLTPDAAGWQAHRALLEAHQSFNDFQFSRLTDDGSVRYFSISAEPLFDGAGAFKGYYGVGTDITERKRAEGALRASEQRFRGLVEQSLIGIYMSDGAGVHYINPRAEEILGYQAGGLTGVSLTPLIIDADRAAVVHEISRLVKGEINVIRTDFRMRRKDDSEVTIGAQILRTHVDGRAAIISVIQDISEKKRAEAEIQRYIAELEMAFMSTVEVATNLGELRDPYTSGHERRMAEIACAIGAEMGLDARRQEGLRVSGYLHDIGKITVPAEILSKPGKLNAIEFLLIQGHAQAGYEVLKKVQFPWPVAEIVWQHHERMDGSGYPRQLKGDAILLEARILAVADVMEAMPSHRPYRASLGIANTLAEIERGRASAYDPEVVDACLRLFREKGYQLPP